MAKAVPFVAKAEVETHSGQRRCLSREGRSENAQRAKAVSSSRRWRHTAGKGGASPVGHSAIKADPERAGLAAAGPGGLVSAAGTAT